MTRHQTIRMKMTTSLTQLDDYLSPFIETMIVGEWPLIKWLFFETNTLWPTSATWVCLFSAVRDIFTPMRARTGYTNFENQVEQGLY